MFLLIAIVVMVGVVFASYDAPPQPKASPDIATFIIQVPPEQYEKHGYSERTAIMYNLARFRELYIESAKQIQMLNDRVKSLEEKIIKLETPPAITTGEDVTDKGVVEKVPTVE